MRIAVSLLWLAALALAEPTAFPWGPYTAAVQAFGDESGPHAGERLVLFRNGEETVLVEDQRVTARTVEVTGNPPPELWVTGYSGGAHCCFSEYVFALVGGRVVALTAGDWGNGGLVRARDLNGDGRAELTFVRVYGYLGGLCYACSPAVWRTFEWRDGRFVDATRRFPEITEKHVREAKKALMQAADRDPQDPYLLGQAATYWINAYALGRGKEAWAWLEAHLAAGTLGWLRDHRIELLRPFSALP